MIDPKRELFKWGPIDGKPCYIWSFVDAFVYYPKFICVSWPDILGYFKDDKVTFVCDYEDLRDAGVILFEKHILNEKKLKNAYEEWIKTRIKIKEFEEKVNNGLGMLSDDRLIKLFAEWNKAYIDYWVKVFLPELANWGGEKILKNRILKFKKIDFIEIFEKLSAPEDYSFFQVEEMDLLRIKLIENKEEQEKRLREHQKKYYWLRNSYGGTEVLSVDFFRKELENISKKEAEKKLREIEEYVDKVKQEKEKIIKKYKIDKETAEIAHKLAYCVWWQDYRKSFIFIASHIITEFLKEISERTDVSFEELCYYAIDESSKNEAEELLKTGKKPDIKPRLEGFVMYYHENDGVEFIAGKKVNEIVNPFLAIEVDPNLKEFSGMVVSKGREKIVKGKAKIILSPKKMEHMNKGDILIASMTSPDFVIAMRKAAAIVTDEGGMTSHAAIVSRELKIPCIVATRIATKLLKNGDEIEVDANKGVVRKLK